MQETKKKDFSQQSICNFVDYNSFLNSITLRKVAGQRSSVKVSRSQRIFICKLSCICTHACPGLIHPIRVVTKQAWKARGNAARDNQAGSFALLHARAFSTWEGEKVTRAPRLVSPTCSCIDPRNCKYLPSSHSRCMYASFPPNFPAAILLIPFLPCFLPS